MSNHSGSLLLSCADDGPSSTNEKLDRSNFIEGVGDNYSIRGFLLIGSYQSKLLGTYLYEVGAATA